jgi:hypothetical protein
MISKPVSFAYGIKLVALWMLIPFVLMFIPRLATEFSAKVTIHEATLVADSFSNYPDEILWFDADINGQRYNVSAPTTAKVGDKVTVVLRDGNYYRTASDDQILHEATTFSGRFLKVTNNNFGYHVIGLAAALLLGFVITIGKGKAIRMQFPVLSKVTNVTGIVVAVIMSAALLFAVIDNSLAGIGVAYISLMIGILYTVVFVLAWIIDCADRKFA